ncbi:hypothetical protein ACTXT7_000827 [Hymenolepis weldensis]
MWPPVAPGTFDFFVNLNTMHDAGLIRGLVRSSLNFHSIKSFNASLFKNLLKKLIFPNLMDQLPLPFPKTISSLLYKWILLSHRYQNDSCNESYLKRMNGRSTSIIDENSPYYDSPSSSLINNSNGFNNFVQPKQTTPRKSLFSNISYNEDSAYSQGTPITSTDDSAIDIPQKRLIQSLIAHLPNTQFLRQQQQIFLDTENCHQ